MMKSYFYPFLAMAFGHSTVFAQLSIDKLYRLGGSASDVAIAMEIDKEDNLVLLTYSESKNFHYHTEAKVSSRGKDDVFVQKLSPTGTLLWQRQIGGTEQERSGTMAIDAAGGVLVGFPFNSTACYVEPSLSIALSTKGLNDVGVVKYDPKGNVDWTLHVGSTAMDGIEGLDVDKDGNCYISGSFGANLKVNEEWNLRFKSGFRNMFLIKVSPTGSVLWAKRILVNEGYGAFLKVDEDNHFYLAGAIRGTGYLNPADSTKALTGNNINKNNSYLAKYTTDGRLVWAQGLYGLNYVEPNSLTVAHNSVYLNGFLFDHALLNPFDPKDTTKHQGIRSTFIVKYDSSAHVKWVKTLGQPGTSYAEVYNVTVDEDENIYLAGDYSGNFDWDPSAAVFPVSGYGPLIVQYNDAGDFVWGTTYKQDHTGNAQKMIRGKDHLYIIGNFFQNMTFPLPTKNETWSSEGLWDSYLTIYSSLVTGEEEQKASLPGVLMANPIAQAQLQLRPDWADASVILYTTDGQPVVSTSLHGTLLSLPPSLSPGMYILYVEKEGKVRQEKVLVE